MKYIRSKKYNTPELMGKIMGPNPVKLEEELLLQCKIPEGAVVCDLGHIKKTISILRQRSRILWGNLWHGFLPGALEKLQYMPQPHRNRKTGNQPKWKNLYLLYSCIDSFLEENSQKIVHNVYY